jgi:hypothetical protein
VEVNGIKMAIEHNQFLTRATITIFLRERKFIHMTLLEEIKYDRRKRVPGMRKAGQEGVVRRAKKIPPEKRDPCHKLLLFYCPGFS